MGAKFVGQSLWVFTGRVCRREKNGGNFMPSETRKKLTTVDISCYKSVVDTFRERLKLRNLSEHTWMNYVSSLIIFLAWCVLNLDSKSACLLDYADFRQFLCFLDQEMLAPRTINVYIATFRQFLYFIQQRDWNRYEIPYRKYDRGLPLVPGIQQAAKMLASCSGLLEEALLKLLFSTGIRLSEACALTFRDILRDRKQIYIRPGKGRSDRYVPLEDSTLRALEAYCRERFALCKAAGMPLPDRNSPVFCFSDGIRPANSSFLRRTYKHVTKKAGLPGFNPHSCRHFFALQIYLQQKDIMLVKNLLGHHTLAATEVYLTMAAPVLLQQGYTNPLSLCEKHDEQ